MKLKNVLKAHHSQINEFSQSNYLQVQLFIIT
jgi:hypothetical protein